VNRRLILFRHAKSSWDDSSQRDFDRPLNKRGLRDAPRMGQFLLEQQINPGIIICSDANRALSTARHVATELSYPLDDIRMNHALYLSSAATILDVLDSAAAKDSDVMLIAHNPGLTELANSLSDTRIDNLPTCSVFIATQAAESWNELGAHAGRFEAFYSPKNDLR
jgi:phosphohistidine phosphatase